MKIKFPYIVEVGDYHEFDEEKENLRHYGNYKKAKVKEIGFDGTYLGIAYMGRLSDKKNAKICKEIEERTKEAEKQ